MCAGILGSRPQAPGPLTPPPGHPKPGGWSSWSGRSCQAGMGQSYIRQTSPSQEPPRARSGHLVWICTSSPHHHGAGDRVLEGIPSHREEDDLSGFKPRRAAQEEPGVLPRGGGAFQPVGRQTRRDGGLGICSHRCFVLHPVHPPLAFPTPSPGNWAALGSPHLLPGPLLPSVGAGAAEDSEGPLSHPARAS